MIGRYCLLICLTIAGCQNPAEKAGQKAAPGKIITTASGLQYSIIKEGSGKEAKAGQEVLIYETASYRDGTIIFSNENTGKPVKVLIGGNQATEGEDEGLRGMKEGETRKMIIPPHLSKRKVYPPNLSPDSIIVVNVELYKIITD